MSKMNTDDLSLGHILDQDEGDDMLNLDEFHFCFIIMEYV